MAAHQAHPSLGFSRQEHWSGFPFPSPMHKSEKRKWSHRDGHWRIDDFELRCWRRLLRVPWTARRSNQSILMKIGPGFSLEGLMLKLKLQYLGHLMQRADSFEKTLVLGKIEGRRKRRWQDEIVGWHHWLNGHGFGWTLGVGDGLGGLFCCGPWGCRVGHKWATELNWISVGRSWNSGIKQSLCNH